MNTKPILFLLCTIIAILISGCTSDGGGGYGGGSRHGGFHGGSRGAGGPEGSNSGWRHGMGAGSTETFEPIIVVEHSDNFSITHKSSEKVVILGTVSCELWTRSLKDANEGRIQRLNSYKAWAYGYASGINAATSSRILDDTDAASMNLFISDYCKGHPGQSTALAVHAFAHEMIARKAPRKP